MIDTSLFDVTKYLQDREIDYVTEGPDVTQGWIGVRCPWCDDHSHHLGINLASNVISCWRCGTKGNITKFIKEVEGINYEKIALIVEEYIDPRRAELYHIEEGRSYAQKVVIPKHFQRLTTKNVPKIVADFISKRGYNLEDTLSRKELYYGGIVGDFSFRLVITVFENKKLVSYLGRDVTEKAGKPYRNLEDNLSVVPIKDTLYGFDEAAPGSVLVIVEGVFDQWTLGPGSVATYGAQWTLRQVSKIRKLSPRKVINLYDDEEDAQRSAQALSRHIWFCPCEVVRLRGIKDPGSLSLE